MFSGMKLMESFIKGMKHLDHVERSASCLKSNLSNGID